MALGENKNIFKFWLTLVWVVIPCVAQFFMVAWPPSTGAEKYEIHWYLGTVAILFIDCHFCENAIVHHLLCLQDNVAAWL